jgi:23S rRNA (adenine2503-C2)-methyltransferase
MLIESVILRIATGRTTLCVSSQVGCAAACAFCATGKMGMARNLSPAEILDQLVQARQIAAAEGRTIRNLVFMGMGELFHNEENLYAVLAALTAPELFHHPASRILVSTVGIPDAMTRAARRFPAIHFALSLHSARQDVRERLIPLAARYDLAMLRRSVVDLNRIQPANTDVMIEYLMLAGVNDSAPDADALVEWLTGLRVHVNLIPYNPIDDAPHLVGSSRKAREAFGALLKSAGIKTTIRYSLGADIAAACGQLVRKENRRIAGATH